MSTQVAVDVLAVLDGDIEGMESVLPRARGKQREDLIAGIQQMREARAAVAELIEAAREFKGKGTFEAEERLDAALARCGGAA